MVSAAASRSSRQPGTNTTPSSSRKAIPPSKKAKLSQSTPKDRSNGFQALLNGKPNKSSPIVAKTNGTKHTRKDRAGEGSAVVGSGIGAHGDVDMADAPKEVIEISSGEDDTDSDDDEVMNAAPSASLKAPMVNGTASQGDQQMEEGTAEPEEMSFGEKLQAQEPDVAVPEVIDVEAAFAAANPDATAVAVSSNKKALAPPSASSLGTVLTQALRTNDQDLLDSCLRVVDVDTIYATVERLPSPLVATLLQKLAERLHKRPGRAGLLMIWVQWSLAAHGGFLASQPHLVKQLSTLNRVLKERASGLQPLLSLKGRLDMLHAQLELRSRNQKRTLQDEENEAVIYVEGEDDESSEEEENQIAIKHPKRKSKQYSEDDEDESSGDDMPTTMAYHDEDDSEEGSEDEEEGMFDDEASETDADTGDDMSEPASDDEDGGEDISGSEEESRRARRSNIGRAGVARRY